MEYQKRLSEGASHGAEGHPRYRADIDGLRAIAVTSVVLFHAGLPGLSGGFVGVDVFFVISGYLIGGIVNRDAARGRFSFASFYARRAKRILPALFAVVLVQSLVALLLLSPAELTHFAQSAGTALVGVSNIRFWRDTGYFSPSAHLDPFLMTWSLGVEEQFYVFLPPMLLLIYRFAPRRLFVLISVTSVLSLILSVALTGPMPSFAFYLLPTRAWELGAGVMLALWQNGRGPVLSATRATVTGSLGLAMIAVSIFAFDGGTPFPGWAAILPVVGTVFALAAEAGAANRVLLSNGAMRFIGLLSYSWYLWHWPMMAFARISYASPPPPTVLGAMALLSLGMAYLSWRFVERPFRQMRVERDGHLLLGYGAALFAIILIPTVFYIGHGLPGRLPAQAAAIERSLHEGRGAPCLADVDDVVLSTNPACAAPHAATRVALLGDSHAGALGDSLRQLVRGEGMGFDMYTKSSCPPLYAATRARAAYPRLAAKCHAYNRLALDTIMRDPSVRTVILTGYWSAGFEDEDKRDGYRLSMPLPGANTPQDILRLSLADTLDRLVGAGKRVILLGDVPRFDVDPVLQSYAKFLPARAAAQRLLGASDSVKEGRIDRALIVQPGGDAGHIVEEAARASPRVIYRSLTDALCDRATCRVGGASDEQIYYVDGQHLTNLGAAYVLDRLDMKALIRSR